MDRLEKVATPEEAATEVVPESVPDPGLVPMAMLTVAEEPVTVLLLASWTMAVMAGAMATPAVAAVGCTPNTTLVAAPGTMLKAVEVSPVRPELEVLRV